MKVAIVAKTRRRHGACVGGITFEGRSVRLEAANAACNERAGLEFNIGDVWEVDARPAPRLLPPHVENVIVRTKRKLPQQIDPVCLVNQHMPPVVGNPTLLYDGLVQCTGGGVLYIAERTGIPAFSTLFWRPDQDLTRDEQGMRLRYRYPARPGLPNSSCTLTFVGFQEPVKLIPAGTLLRVSLAHWWRPADRPDDEPRCYVQLSGWFGLEMRCQSVAVRKNPVAMSR